MFRLHGITHDIVSGRDTLFTTEIPGKTSMHLSRSPAYHPQSESHTARTSRTLEDMLTHFVSPAQIECDKYFNAAGFAIIKLGRNPFRTHCSHELWSTCSTPASVEVGNKVPTAKVFAEDLAEAEELAKCSLRSAHDNQAHHANSKQPENEPFKAGGQLVLSTKTVRLQNPATQANWSIQGDQARR